MIFTISSRRTPHQNLSQIFLTSTEPPPPPHFMRGATLADRLYMGESLMRFGACVRMGVLEDTAKTYRGGAFPFRPKELLS